MFDALTGKDLNEGKPLQHKTDVVCLSLSHAGPSADRLLALLDKNHDLHITTLRGAHANKMVIIGKET